jgi:hypothetical protein
MLKETERIGDQSLQADLAEHQRSGPGVVEDAAQR